MNNTVACSSENCHAIAYCKGLCKPHYQRQYVKNNKERLLIQSRDYYRRTIDRQKEYHLYRQYKIRKDEYDKILAAQAGKCAICGSESPLCKKRSRLYVDHDHKTGKIRGLLCNRCNQGIGYLRESPENLFAAFNYLEDYRLGLK